MPYVQVDVWIILPAPNWVWCSTCPYSTSWGQSGILCPSVNLEPGTLHLNPGAVLKVFRPVLAARSLVQSKTSFHWSLGVLVQTAWDEGKALNSAPRTGTPYRCADAARLGPASSVSSPYSEDDFLEGCLAVCFEPLLILGPLPI